MRKVRVALCALQICQSSLLLQAQILKTESAIGSVSVTSSNGTVRHTGVSGTVSQGAGAANQAGPLWANLDFRPAQPATAISFSNLTPTSVQVNWTNGNGTRRLVLVRAGAPVDATPASATFYSADATLGGGSAVSATSFAVYEGTGNSVTLTGLAPSTRYHVKVFEYNGKYGANNANIEYQTGDGTGNPANRLTLALPPSQAAAALAFTNITKNSQTVSWQNGNGAQRLVLVRKDIAPTATPANGEVYLASANFGGRELGSGNSVVFNGAGNQVQVTGLEPNTIYHYQVIEYRGSGEDNHYLLTNVPVASQITLTDEPVAKEEEQVSQNTFTASWNAVAGANAYYLDVSDNPAFNSFVPGNQNRIVPAGLSASVTGLDPGTVYYYRVRAENAAGSSANSNVIEALTLAAAPVLLASNPVAATSFTANWTATKSALDYRLDVATDAAFTQFVSSDFSNREVTGTSQLVTGLSPGTIHFVRVRARNATGLSAFSSPLEQITRPVAPALFQPQPADIQETSFVTKWERVKGADKYLVYVETETIPRQQAPGSPFEALGTASSRAITGLLARTYYYHYVRAVNAGGESDKSEEKLFQTKGDPNPLAIAIVTSETSATRAAASIANGRGPYRVTFGYRPISGRTFTRLESVTNTAATVRQDLNAAWGDELGLEYYFKVTDQAAATDSVRGVVHKPLNVPAIPALEAAFNGNRGGYQIFSIPAELFDKTITAVLRPLRSQFNGYDKTKWRLFHYPGGVDQEYLEYETDLFAFDPGQGYWLNAVERLNPVPLTGSVIKADQANPFTLELARGWNQIGNPYPFNIDWTAVQADKRNEAAGLNALWVPGGGTYQKANVMNAWRGGFVFSDNGGKLTFPVTSRTSASGRTQQPENVGALDDPHWLLTLEISQAHFRQRAAIGMHPEARLSKDAWDEMAIPRFVQFVEMTTHHPEFFAPRFSTDVVPTNVRYEWLFGVASSEPAGSATVSWDHEALASTTATLLLVDRHESRWLDMKTIGSYEFTWDNARQLSIIYHREGEWQPGITLLGTAYPNPFRQSVTIPVLTERVNQLIEVQVFDLTGRSLRILKNVFDRPGPNALVWDGADEAGMPVSAGPLFYRFKNGTTPTRAKRIVKQ